jgi:hypothetical protein
MQLVIVGFVSFHADYLHNAKCGPILPNHFGITLTAGAETRVKADDGETSSFGTHSELILAGGAELWLNLLLCFELSAAFQSY